MCEELREEGEGGGEGGGRCGSLEFASGQSRQTALGFDTDG